MKLSKLLIILLVALTTTFSSCEKDEPSSSSSSSSSSTAQTVTKPEFDKYLSYTDLYSFSIMVRFKTGGDKESNLSATAYWKAYPSKPSKTPTKNDLSNIESMRQYGSAIYHNTGPKKGMTESVVFEKAHAGFNGGTYIYYYVECKNSKGSANTGVTYMIIKR